VTAVIPAKTDQPPLAIPAGVAVDEAARVAGGDAANAASLDKVRDILFGGHVRDIDRRFGRIEERLTRETSDLKDDVRRRVEALELYARKETESLAGQIRSERDDRAEAADALSRELKESARALERRIAALDEQLAKSQREMRQLLLEQHQRLSDDIRQRVDDVLAALARETHALRTDKADRAAIATLLTEMAMRLTNELRIPGTEGLENG
jgi:DNA repair exonuclease SbcCD ATPase subunit